MGAYFQALFGIWVLAPTSFFSVYCLASFYNPEIDDPPAYKPAYSRFKEIKKECSPVLAEASELHPEKNRLYMIEQDLFFVNGDWKQHKGSAPLLPFTRGQSNHTIPFRRRVSNYTRSCMRRNSNYIVPGNYSPINLASFWITDVDLNKVSGKVVNVSGILQLAISPSGLISCRSLPGFTSLTIHLEGVYLEESKKSKERLLCMLAVRGKSAADPWDWLNKKSVSQSPTLSEDRILLQLRYPSKLSLTTREIRGTLGSLNRLSSSSYFDEIDISSQ